MNGTIGEPESHEPGVPTVAQGRTTVGLVARFGIAGLFNSAVHALLFGGLAQVPGFDYGPAIVFAAWLLSIPIAFVVQSRFVWHTTMSWAGLAKLAVSYVPGAGLSTASAAVLASAGAGLVVQEVATIIVAALVSFFLQKYWVYR